MKSLFFVLFALIVLFATAQQGGPEVPLNNSKIPDSNRYANTKLTYNITNVLNGKYGYDIYVDGKMMIQQKSIPAINGNEGFANKVSAEKVAQLVIQKIKKGEMPPSVTIEEMRKLKVLPK